MIPCRHCGAEFDPDNLPGGTEIDESLITALKGLMPADQQPDNDRACVEVPVIR